MNRIIKLLLFIIIVGILLGASAYIIFYTGDNSNNNNGQQDTEAPQITDIPGNFTVTAGQTATITVLFSDNVNVTEVALYYKTAGAASWTSKSILSGTAQISIPSSATSNYYYYITVDDAAGNGPVGDPSIDGSLYYVITVKPGGNGQDNETFTHTVFIEEATWTECTYCPNVANILHSLYESHNYNFYYVSLINDTNQIAANRNWNEYHVAGFPTVFIDGGYSVFLGGNLPESDYADAIVTAQDRVIPPIKITVTAQYKNTTGEVTVNAVVENKGNDSYSGRLKLYLTEIISHTTGYDSKPYHYAFLEYLIDDDVTIARNDKETYTETKDISAYDYENLMIIAVVFSSEKHQGYANPSDTTNNLFDAYYADATNATKVVQGGNLPPQLQITSPLKGKVYVNGKLKFENWIEREITSKLLNRFLKNTTLGELILHNKTILLGKKIITVTASDDSTVAKVEFYVDGTLQYNDTEAPYEWSFKKIPPFRTLFIREHTLKVIVYDDAGKTNSAQLVFKARI